jgi:predicted transposase YdaD
MTFQVEITPIAEAQIEQHFRLKLPQLRKLKLNKPIAGIERVILSLLIDGFED